MLKIERKKKNQLKKVLNELEVTIEKLDSNDLASVTGGYYSNVGGSCCCCCCCCTI